MRKALAGDWVESASQITLKDYLNDFIVD